MKKSLTVFVGVLLLAGGPLDASNGLAMAVSPNVAFAPATVRVRATVNANSENRAIQIVAESADFYRSSEIPLDGAQGPRTTVVEFRGLPGGTYRVTAILIRVSDRMTVVQQLTIE